MYPSFRAKPSLRLGFGCPPRRGGDCVEHEPAGARAVEEALLEPGRSQGGGKFGLDGLGAVVVEGDGDDAYSGVRLARVGVEVSEGGLGRARVGVPVGALDGAAREEQPTGARFHCASAPKRAVLRSPPRSLSPSLASNAPSAKRPRALRSRAGGGTRSLERGKARPSVVARALSVWVRASSESSVSPPGRRSGARALTRRMSPLDLPRFREHSWTFAARTAVSDRQWS